MRSASWCLAGWVLILSGCISTGDRLPPLETVAYVDLNRYLGRWYEIAKLPTSFEQDCTGVTATYSLRPDGNIRVLNRCLKHSLDDRVDQAEGRAWVVDPKTNAKLKVSFFLWFAGDYWIIELGPDYDYAVVGDPSRKFLWFLCRRPVMPEVLYADLLKRAAAKGFDVSRMEKTLQPAQPDGEAAGGKR